RTSRRKFVTRRDGSRLLPGSRIWVGERSSRSRGSEAEYQPMAMTEAVRADGIVRAADGTPLKLKLAQAERRERLKSLGLIAPLFLFIVITFLLPIAWMLVNAIHDTDLRDNLAATVEALRDWDGKALPGEPVFAALAQDMKAANQSKQTALIGKRLNYEISGIRSKVITAGRKLSTMDQGPWKEAV